MKTMSQWTTIGCRKETRDKLKEMFKKSLSFEEILNKLMEEYQENQ